MSDRKDIFEPKYYQFKDKPELAIKYLRKVKKGEAVSVIKIDTIGYIDFVWGENNPKTNKGFGLKHIIEKHEKHIKKMGFTVEKMIPFVLKYGNVNLKQLHLNKVIFENKYFRVVIKTVYNDKKKNYLLTAFDIKFYK